MLQNAKRLVKQYYPYLYELRDIRVASMVVFVVVVLLVSWSGIKAIDSNYRLQKQISQLQQENQLFELNDENTALQNDYYKTNQYLDLSARQNLGLAAPGETELIVPEEVALSHTVPLPATEATTAKASSKQPVYQKNIQAWVNFFLHRQSSTD